MKHISICLAIIGLAIVIASSSPAVTVYFKDGTQLKVERISRIGNSVCLLLDISKIDTSRTEIEELPGTTLAPQKGLTLSDVDFSPSDDNSEIIATGNVVNNSAYTVQRVRVTVILMDKDDNVLLKIQGYVRPEKLLPGQTGSYRLQVKKPKGFSKASVDVHGDAV